METCVRGREGREEEGKRLMNGKLKRSDGTGKVSEEPRRRHEVITTGKKKNRVMEEEK